VMEEEEMASSTQGCRRARDMILLALMEANLWMGEWVVDEWEEAEWEDREVDSGEALEDREARRIIRLGGLGAVTLSEVEELE
jgi:hypothetical protein